MPYAILLLPAVLWRLRSTLALTRNQINKPRNAVETFSLRLLKFAFARSLVLSPFLSLHLHILAVEWNRSYAVGCRKKLEFCRALLCVVVQSFPTKDRLYVSVTISMCLCVYTAIDLWPHAKCHLAKMLSTQLYHSAAQTERTPHGGLRWRAHNEAEHQQS